MWLPVCLSVLSVSFHTRLWLKLSDWVLSGGSTGSFPAMAPKATSTVLFNTLPCKFFGSAKGCAKGQACEFVHNRPQQVSGLAALAAGAAAGDTPGTSTQDDSRCNNCGRRVLSAHHSDRFLPTNVMSRRVCCSRECLREFLKGKCGLDIANANETPHDAPAPATTDSQDRLESGSAATAGARSDPVADLGSGFLHLQARSSLERRLRPEPYGAAVCSGGLHSAAATNSGDSHPAALTPPCRGVSAAAWTRPRFYDTRCDRVLPSASTEAEQPLPQLARPPRSAGAAIATDMAECCQTAAAAIATDMAAAAAEHTPAEAQVAVLTLIDEYPPKLPPPPNPMQQARCSICDLRPCRTACRTCRRGACFHDNCYDIPKRSCVPCLRGGNPQEVRGKWVVGPLDSSSAGRSVGFQHLGG